MNLGYRGVGTIFKVCVLVIVLAPLPVFGVTYYADSSAANDLGDGSSASPKKYIGSCAGLLSSGDTCIVRSGTYSHASSDRVNSAVSNITIRGEDADNPPIIEATNILYDVFYANGSNQTYENFIIRNLADTAEHCIYNVSGSGNIFRNIELDNCSEAGASTAFPIFLGGGSNILLDKIYIHGNTGSVDGSKHGIRVGASVTGTVTINATVVDGNSGVLNSGIADQGLATVTLNNVFTHGVKFGYNSSATSGSATKTINNSTLLSRRPFGGGNRGVQGLSSGVTINVNNSVATGGSVRPDINAYSAVGTVNKADELLVDPEFVKSGKDFGIVSLVFDWDNYNDQVNIDIAQTLHSLGIKATFAINAQYFQDSAYGRATSTLATVAAYGHDIGSHGWSHTRLDPLVKDAFSVYYTGTGTATLSLSGNTLTTSIVGGAGEEELNIDLTAYDGSSFSDSLTGMVSFINAKADYVAALSSGTIEAKSQATSLADIVAEDITGLANIYTLQTDANYLLRDEILDNTQWLETNNFSPGYEVVSSAYAGNSQNTTTRDYFRAFDGVSSGQHVKIVRGGEDEDNFSLSAFDPSRGLSVVTTELDTLSSTDFIRVWRDIAMSAVEYGEIYFMYMHADDFSSDGDVSLSAANEQRLRDAIGLLQSSGATVYSMREVYDYLNTPANGWVWNAGNNTFDKTLSKASENYNLTALSSAIDAGTSVGLTADVLGNPVYGTPDIGAYEYQPPYTVGTDDIQLTGEIRVYADGRYRYRTATSSASTANITVAPQGGNYYSGDYSEYMDLSINSWDTTGDRNKQWTATSSVATTTVYTVGDLLAETYYQFKVDGVASTTAVTGLACNDSGACQTDSSGNLTFTYTGGYSTHTFALERDTAAPTSFNLVSPAGGSSVTTTQPAFSWNASTDASSGVSYYQLYLDGVLNMNTISGTSATMSGLLACGAHTWYVKAVDNAGNSVTSNTSTVTRSCGGGIPSLAPASLSVGQSTVPDQKPALAVATTTPAASQDLPQIQVRLLQEKLLVLLQELLRVLLLELQQRGTA